MELNQLETFLAVAEEKSFSKAAVRLHRTQPAVSQVIRKLEASIGETLFDRAARDGSLTASGVLLRDYALRLLALRREAASALGELKSLERGRLQLAANEYTCMYLLPAIDRFRREFPHISVTVHRMLASKIPEELNLRTFEIGVISFRPDPALCAATERCSWRGRVLRGEVHDENAFALGGAAGHAGLFGTVDGVLDAAQTMLAALPPGLKGVRERQSATRTLGWEAKHDGWSGGDACSEDTIGHTGFTGTGLWIDFGRGLAWTLLTNRVHPTRHRDSGILSLRREVGNRIAAAAREEAGHPATRDEGDR